MNDDAQAAGAIAAIGATVIGLLLKARSSFASDNRKIAHDEHTSKMEDDLRAQNVELRQKVEAGWKKHVEDAASIAQLKSTVAYLEEKLGRTEEMMMKMQRDNEAAIDRIRRGNEESMQRMQDEINRLKKEHP